MTDEAEIREKIIALERHHRGCPDGGYALAEAIADYVRHLPEEIIDCAVGVLLGFISAQERNLWGVALESLVRLERPGVDNGIAKLLESAKRTPIEWRDELVFSLIRLRTAAHAGYCVNYVKDAFKRRRDSVDFLLPSLVFIDRHTFVDLAATYWIRTLKRIGIRRSTDAESAIATFIMNIAKVDPSILAALVREIASRKPALRDKFSILVTTYLDRPWVKKEWQPAVLNELRQALGN